MSRLVNTNEKCPVCQHARCGDECDCGCYGARLEVVLAAVRKERDEAVALLAKLLRNEEPVARNRMMAGEVVDRAEGRLVIIDAKEKPPCLTLGCKRERAHAGPHDIVAKSKDGK